MTKQLAPIEELANQASGKLVAKADMSAIEWFFRSDVEKYDCLLTFQQLEQLRQAIIRDFVSTLEPIAWTYTKRNGEPTVTLDFNFATIVIGDGFDVTRLFDLSEWSK